MRYSKNGRGWFGNSRGHSLARQGIKTANNKTTAMNKVPRKELEYKDFNDKQKKGIQKFAVGNSKDMEKWEQFFEEQTGLRASHIDNKGAFYEFVADNEIEKTYYEPYKERILPKEDKPKKVDKRPTWVNMTEKKNIGLRQGKIPKGNLNLLHYYILEDSNFHTLNNELTKMGKFGAFRTSTGSDGKKYYTPLEYGNEKNEKLFKKYQSKGGQTWQV